MKIRIMMCLFFVIGLSIVTSAFATELPPAPKGYSWAKFDESKSAFLKPDGWFVKKGKQGETWGYFITKENIDKAGKFKTGLTINIIPHIPAKEEMLPTRFAYKMIDDASKSRKVIKEPWSTDMGPFQAFGVVTLNEDDKGGDFITHQLAIGNDTTGTMYIIIFEAPASSWKAAWKTAEPIFQRFLIDSDI